jgi:hypothetical protein
VVNAGIFLNVALVEIANWDIRVLSNNPGHKKKRLCAKEAMNYPE